MREESDVYLWCISVTFVNTLSLFEFIQISITLSTTLPVGEVFENIRRKSTRHYRLIKEREQIVGS